MNLFIKSILFYLLFLSFAVAFRLVFLLLHMDEGYGVGEIFASVFSSAIRFDFQTIGYTASAYYLLRILDFKPLRLAVRGFFIIVSLFFLAANCSFFVFYNIYGTNFDNQLFLFRNEKFSELFGALISSNYGIFPAIFAFLLLSFVFLYLFIKLDKAKFFQKSNIFYNIFSFFIFAGLMILSINQNFSFKAVSINNYLIYSSYRAINVGQVGHLRGFIKALKSGLVIKQHKFSDFGVESPRAAACKILSLSPCPEHFDIREVARNQVAITPLENRPDKIFYVISESLSDWIKEDRFKPLWGDVLARENLVYLSSIENAPSTAISLAAQFMGVFENQTNNYHFYHDIKPLPTNIISRAIAAGYEVHFYFGGAYNWSGLFDLQQKLDDKIHIHTQEMIRKWAKNITPPHANNWGVFDDILFAYARDVAPKNSLNIFMTLTNHPVYDLAWQERAIGETNWQKIGELSQKYKNELATVQWYLRALDGFLASAKDDELYLITGDHYGRYNIDDSPDALLTHAVPVMAYMKNQRLFPATAACSHLGIAASIFALVGKKDDVTLANACFSAAKQEIVPSDFYGFDYSFVDGKIIPTPKEATALGWHLAYEGSEF